MVLTFFRQDRTVIADIPTGESKSSAIDMHKYATAIKKGEILAAGADILQTPTSK